MFVKIYILLSPIIAWGGYILMGYIAFGGIKRVHLSNIMGYSIVTLLFAIPISASILFWRILRKQKLKENIWCLFAMIPNILLLFFLTGEAISGMMYLSYIGYLFVGISSVLLVVWFFALLVYLPFFLYSKFLR
jgi:hypothetical protein